MKLPAQIKEGSRTQPSCTMKHPKPIRTWVDASGFSLNIRITAQNAVLFMAGEKKKEASK